MPAVEREVWITGLGIASSLGEGPQAQWQALEAGRINADVEAFRPYLIHPLVPLELDRQIPKKGDQRQMEPWQRIGTYVAGLALDDAGVKGNADILGRMDLIVGAGCGERDVTVDTALMTQFPHAADPQKFLNERLTSDLRPTLFLAQLSNLLAGNISIVHGVTGSSRTVLGEETAGHDAVRIAAARIVSGQSDVVLVGAAFNAERKDILLHSELGAKLWRGPPVDVWERGPRGGMALGSMGAFLVLESPDHAKARAARARARLTRVMTDWTRRQPGAIIAALNRMWETLAPGIESGKCVSISGAGGVQPATGEERAFFAAHPELPVRATATHIGMGLDAQFPINIALACMLLEHGELFAPRGPADVERPFDASFRQVLVTGVGHWRSEAMALVEAIE